MPPSSSTLRRVCLVRHGITAPQEQRRYCGHSDPPLSPRGEEQMRALRTRLAAELPSPVCVFTSDLRRAVESATILTGAAPTLALPELREIHFGTWEGKRFEETGCQDVEQLRDPNFCFPGGESAALLRARVAAAWTTILQLEAGPEIVIVAHAGSLAALLLVFGNAPGNEIWGPALEHGGVVWWSGDGEVTYG